MSLREKRSKGRNDQVMPFGVTEASGESHDEDGDRTGKRSSRRKRTATEQATSKELDDEEEARKKARGRPRVDTKDETAADVSHRLSSYCWCRHILPVLRDHAVHSLDILVR